MHRGLRESAFIALGVLAIVLFAALASYNPEDRGYSSTGESAVIHNRVGPIGAWLADVLFFLFGRPAFLFPFMLVLWCSALLRHRSEDEPGSRANTAVRVGGFVLVLLASCGLATLHWDPGSLRQTAGGVVGDLIGEGLAAGLEVSGRDAAAAGGVDGRAVARLRRLLAHDHGPVGRLDLARHWLGARAAWLARDVAHGSRAQAGAQGSRR